MKIADYINCKESHDVDISNSDAIESIRRQGCKWDPKASSVVVYAGNRSKKVPLKMAESAKFDLLDFVYCKMLLDKKHEEDK